MLDQVHSRLYMYVCVYVYNVCIYIKYVYTYMCMYLYTYIWQFLIKLITPLVYDPPISFLDIYSPKMKWYTST